jgi:hypothetical protein
MPKPDTPDSRDSAPAGRRATGEAARPMLAPARRRKRRWMVIQSVLVTFVLISAWVGVMVGYQLMSTPAYSFRAETQQVLERIRDGKAEQVYRESSPLLQEIMIADRFLELASDIRGALGGFRQILAIKQVESLSGPGGKTGRAQATLEFDRGKTSSHFSYHWSNGEWRLLGFNVDIPEHLNKEIVTSRSETRLVRVEAPAEVHALVRQTLQRVSDDQDGAVYDEASPTFKQSISRATFLELQDQRRSSLGKYVRILDTVESRRNLSRSTAQVTVLAQYEKAKTTVTIHFIKIDDIWKLAHYKVVMPQPRIPRLSEPMLGDEPE